MTKTDVGLYSYENHIIKYNDNSVGAISQDRQNVTYASFHRPLTITEGNYEAAFTYGSDNERIIYELHKAGALESRKLYLPDGVEIIEDGAGNQTVVTYVPGVSGIAMIQTDLYGPAGNASGSHEYYPYTDHLGSVNALVEKFPWAARGQVVYEQAFDPWGRRRDALTWATDDNAIPPADLSWLRGYTGHEHLDEFSLINMNARLYDPKLGRMLSVDNFVSVPHSAMGYNRYTYALNNPISVIDPSGNEPLLLTAILIGAALGGASYTASAAFAPGGLQKNFNIGGFLGSVGIGAVSGAVSFGVGSIFGSTATGALTASSVFNEAGRAAAHGLVGMGFSVVQGGDAWSGFASGLLGSAAGSAVQMGGFGFTKTLVGGGIFSMGVGAGTSYITGGDPWIGAALGGLSFYANHMLHGDGGGEGDEEKKHIPAPKNGLPAYPDAGNGSYNGKSGRWRWYNKKNILEWDKQHGEVEKYDKTGQVHKGGFDPNTGEQRSPAKDDRWTPKFTMPHPEYDGPQYGPRYGPIGMPSATTIRNVTIGAIIGAGIIYTIQTYGPYLIFAL